MKHAFVAFLLLALGVPAVAADKLGLVRIQIPKETAEFKPGPGVEKVEEVCLKCHSADYVYMQPPLTRQQWTATVVKMKKVMGAPVADGDVDVIVGYLMSQNGKN